ncbi:MAG: acyl-CoA dehydrogenase family protein [Candidatus Thermoplasmatota archaeon]|nr:acyl-CoA dehydrogenase family protein [Candidatus Thermoplasmatota archaeon]
MPFHLTEEQEMIRRVVEEFADKTVGPAAREVDRERRAPTEALKGMKGLGLMGMLASPDDGGAGADTVTYCIAVRELAKKCASTAALMGVTNALAVSPLAELGTEEQRGRWLQPLATGEKLGSFALTEPDAGADVSKLNTKLVPDGEDTWLLSGHKAWTLAAPLADVFLVMARGEEGPSLVLVPADAEGVEAGPPERMLGLHGTETGPIYFHDVEVPRENVLGEVGEGLEAVSDALRISRLAVAACATGLIEAGLDDSIEFADQREQFRQPIREFQAMQNRLADMKVAASSSLYLTLLAADARDRGEPFSVMASEAKWFATEAAARETRSAIRLHGGTGFMRDANVERYYRDARTLKIMGGPNVLHKQRIVRSMYE